MGNAKFVLLLACGIALASCVSESGGNYSVTPDGYCTNAFVRDFEKVREAHSKVMADPSSTLDELRRACADFKAVHPSKACKLRVSSSEDKAEASSTELDDPCSDVELDREQLKARAERNSTQPIASFSQDGITLVAVDAASLTKALRYEGEGDPRNRTVVTGGSLASRTSVRSNRAPHCELITKSREPIAERESFTSRVIINSNLSTSGQAVYVFLQSTTSSSLQIDCFKTGAEPFTLGDLRTIFGPLASVSAKASRKK